MKASKAAKELSKLGVQAGTKPRKKECCYCNTPFTAYHGKAKYCSESCRVMAFNKKRRESHSLICGNQKPGPDMKLYLEGNVTYCIECGSIVGKITAVAMEDTLLWLRK